jgi:glycosyltransferase involved in cell wall biosynthesis
MHRPFCSIIVPAHNAAHLLPTVLGAIRNSDYPREHYELIVVDDASADDSPNVAARYADTVVRIPGRPFGPAYARNRGFEVSRGSIAMFLDSDVVVHEDTISAFVKIFTEHPDVGAVFGSYDDRPAAPGFVSQYRNLIHHYTHQKNPGDAETFWAGAGAVRRDVFERAGMYDEWHYPRPQIEDIELGGRIRSLGHRILLRPEVQVTHLKRWTLMGVLRTDLKDRGIPWARLLAHSGALMTAAKLNLRWTEKLNTALVWLAAVTLLLAPFVDRINLWLVALAALLVVIGFNMPLLRFFVRARGVLFAMGVVPLQLMYYLLNGISFGFGMLLQQLIGAPLPHPTVDAFSEVGIKRWPPVPSRKRSTWTGHNG